MKDLLLQRIFEFKETELELKNLVKDYVQNKDFPLDERWEVFENSDLGDHEIYYVDFKSINLVDIYELNRYEIVNVIDKVQNIIEDYEYCLENKEEYRFTLEQINDLKEEVLEEFVKSFKFDW